MDLEVVENNKTMRKKHNLEDKDKALHIAEVISRFSGENLMKLQKHFVDMYGDDKIAKEKANSFAVGFGKACELICKDLSNGL